LRILPEFTCFENRSLRDTFRSEPAHNESGGKKEFEMGMKDRGLIALPDENDDTRNTLLMRQLQGRVRGFKIESPLLYRGAQRQIQVAAEYGLVFADAKVLRIPTQAYAEVKALAKAGAHLVSVHAHDKKMVRACVEAYAEYGPNDGQGVIGISLLTSHDKKSCRAAYRACVSTTVKRFAGCAAAAGAWGVVCAPWELEMLKVKPEMHGMHYATPSIRLDGEERHDQRRTGTPNYAIKQGADLIIVGRSVTGSRDPLSTVIAYDRNINE
jgi:orotidine-5'-phosphate decarboxylase